jgi:S1-C subfamily serine protease
VVIERYREPNQAENDYVPQLNSTTAQLGSLVGGGAVLGVTMDPEYPKAAVVRQVIPGSSAEKAGLRAGDMITAIDKREIHSPADVSNVVVALQPSDQIEIQFVRPILRSEVKEAAPEKGLEGATPSPKATAPVPPPVPQPSPSS